MNKDSIGIDISKAHLDAYRLRTGQLKRFSNDAKGFREVLRWISNEMPDLIVYEATGPCHGALEHRFANHLPLVKVNPLQARRFAQATGTRAKTDAVDARMPALMGDAPDLEPDVPCDKDHKDLKELQIARQALIKDRTRLKNRIRTQNLAITRRQTKARLAQVARQIETLDEEIKSILKASPMRARACDILTSIPGIGAVAAAAILIECPEIGSMARKQVASLAGLAPMTRQSGRWKGQAFIQGGRKYLCDALYMPALVAIRFNADCKAKYNAMKARGKPSKVAITAIMRKLIQLANTLIKQNRVWMEINP